MKNSILNERDSQEKGREIYAGNCMPCHGDNAEGLDAREVGLEKSPPNLGKRIKTHSDGDLFWIIQNGNGEMPSFRDDLEDDEIWSAINFLRRE